MITEPNLFFYTFRSFLLFLSNTNTQLNDRTILLQTIQFSISTPLLVYTQSFFYINILFIYSHTVRCKNSSISNNSVYHEFSFVHTHLNDETVLFQKI